MKIEEPPVSSILFALQMFALQMFAPETKRRHHLLQK
jgi:hypothetical protein